MTKQEAKKRIEKLKKVIKHHRYLYHVLDKQEISDAALDSLKQELQKLENKFPQFVTEDSPTQRVAGQPLDKFEKVTRTNEQRMNSLNDAFSQDDMRAWWKRLVEYLEKMGYVNVKEEFYCDLKMDGLAIELVYDGKNGLLRYASTRGNGLMGEVVTQNIKTISAIPLRLELSNLENKKQDYFKSIGEIRIRGEVFLPEKEFNRINIEQEKRGDNPYANPRNIAAGSIRQLDPKITASRKLNFFAYGIWGSSYDEKYFENFPTHQSEYSALTKMGLSPNKKGKVIKELQEVFSFFNGIEKIRDSLPYQIDGIVISLNNTKFHSAAGVTGKAPRASIAYKFAAEQATTIIEDIKVHVGRTGAITPVAILKPIKISGATISRASLHNYDEIKRLGVLIGDTVVVERAGDVIPKIVAVIKNLRSRGAKEFQMPNLCPDCDKKLEKKESEAILRCINLRCESRKHQHMNYFVSKAGFDIDGLGPKIIERLMDTELISDPADIFSLTEGDLTQLEGFQEKSAGNIIIAIEESKRIQFFRFINSLNIRHVGEETAIDLSQEFGSIEALQKASLEELQSLEGIGDITAKYIFTWFSDKENKNFIQKLLAGGVKIITPKRVYKKLQGKTFVFTGTMENITRNNASEKVRNLGGKVASSVSKSTDYVVLGKNSGSKEVKAKKLGVSIINEKEFLKLIV